MARIEDYALIGDCGTAALVSRHGSIDWLCLPRFDSGACFAALLGTSDHGSWRIAPDASPFEASRAYLGATMILATTFRTSEGAVELIDFLVPGATEPTLVRLVRGVEGVLSLTSELVIRFDHGMTVPRAARGVVTTGFLRDVAEICAQHQVRSATIRGLAVGRRIRLEFSRGMPTGCRQQIRNVWEASGWSVR